MLEINNLSISLKDGKEIIKNVKFSLEKNDKIAIIGEEGNGKSTLLKCIYDENLITNYADIKSGKIIKNNVNIGYLEQFLDKEWDDEKVEDYFLKENVNSNIDYERYSNIYLLNDIFYKLNINIKYLNENYKISMLSGGEKVKIRLAKLLFYNKDILLLDEPTNDLDIMTLQWLEDFLKSTSMPILFISHDEVLLENVANGILHIERLDNKKSARCTYERIGYREYVEKRNLLINKEIQIAKNEKREYEKRLEKFRKMYDRVNHELNTVSRQNPHGGRLLKKKMKNVKSYEKRIDNMDIKEVPKVEEKIYFKFHNDDDIHSKKVILDFKLDILKTGNKVLSKDICLKVVGKEKVCIIGENGCGKTTLIKQIYDNLSSNNTIKVGYMPQNYDEKLDVNISPIEYLKNEYTKEEETLARTYMGSMNFTKEEMENKISSLSGGQKAKLFLVNLIVKKCNVLILDEPTRNLSPLSTSVIYDMLRKFNGAIISISHDRKFITNVCDSVYYMTKDGLKLM